jgi:hypothetical protein
MGGDTNMKKEMLLALALLAMVSMCANADLVNFSTFVTGPSIIAAEGQNNTIAYTYAGNKFVGSVYFGANNLQLYSTDLTGGNVQKFGNPLPAGGGEVVLAGALGKGGFTTGDIYAGSGNQLYHYGNGGGAPVAFGAAFDGGIRGILFDPGASFGGKMLVSTTNGKIWVVDSAGNESLLASVGEDTEGMDIATTAWGAFAGQVLVSSEGSGALRLISNTGVVTDTGVRISAAETVSFVPQDFGLSGNPLEGFYVANYPVDIQKAGNTSEFSGLLGDSIITSEFGSNSPLTYVKFDGTNFTTNVVGHLANQSEDGIFVTAQRIKDTGVPEPASVVLLGTVMAGLGTLLRRKLRA